MFGRPRYRAVGMLGIPYYVLFECLAPIVQTLALVALVATLALGLLDWPSYLAFFGLMAFATALPTTFAIGLHDVGYRDYRVADLIRMLALGPLDLLLYRPIILFAGLRGSWEFVRKDKRWKKFERNVRRAPAVAGTQ